MKKIRQTTKEGSLTLVRNNKGFTLIELAVVLVIIGLILGSVIKGKDLITSAKQKNFYASFIKTWELAIATYYDRTGFLLGDGLVNGGTAASPDGIFDNVGTDFSNVEAILRRVGLEVPTTNTGNSGTMAYSGSTGSATVSMFYRNLASVTDGRAGNRLYFTGMPTDLAVALDRIIDGQTDSANGEFRIFPDNTGAGVWPSVQTQATVNASYRINFP